MARDSGKFLVETPLPAETARFNGHSMVDPLRRVVVCSPKTAGWDKAERAARWQELGFLHKPDFEKAQSQHTEMCRQLDMAGTEVLELCPANELSLDAVYAHDASLPTDFGLVVMRPGKANRIAEAGLHLELCQTMFQMPMLAKVAEPASTEAGDMVWLKSKTLLVGNGYRTNADGVAQMRTALSPQGIEVIAAPLPYGSGPSVCLHLMSLISLLDEHTALVDLPWLAVVTVELLKAQGYGFIEIDYRERETLACNVLSLGNKRLLALEENPRTNLKLRAAGFDLRTFPGSELSINGGGGPTCLSRPLLRA
jgi:N-dimethylarginine dimethylaminohydrolase